MQCGLLGKSNKQHAIHLQALIMGAAKQGPDRSLIRVLCDMLLLTYLCTYLGSSSLLYADPL
jgi:hypothetical protein